MDTTDLADAYHQLIEAAGGITDTTGTAAERADVDWLLAHIALSDRILATAARHVLAGTPEVVVDNAPAMDERTIGELIAATTHPERIDVLRRNAAELIDLITQIPESAASTQVRLRIHNRQGQHVSDSQLAWDGLVRIRAEKNIPGHALRLADIAAHG
jgi:hypothetical protein